MSYVSKLLSMLDKSKGSTINMKSFIEKEQQSFNNLKVPADLPEAGASAERISSVVRSDATTGWIKVSERLPEINIPVLAIIPDVFYPAYAFRANNADEYMVYYFNGVKRCNTVTHWMPLPEPPK